MTARIVHSAPDNLHRPPNTGDGTEFGDPYYTLVNNINSNFSELFGRTGGNSGGSATAGIATASSAVVLDASKNVTGLGAGVTFLGGGGTGTFKPSGNISAQLSLTGAGNGTDTTEDTLFTYTMPASTFDAAGRGVQIMSWGTLANNANSKTVKVYFGATAYSLGSVTTANVGWDATLEIYKTDVANNQVGVGFADLGATRIAATNLKTTETESGVITIKVTGTSGTAAQNNIVANGLVVTFMD